MDKQSLYTLMEDHGIRPTANRVLIASALLKGDGPKTMKELETALLSIDKSVISRTMALFRSHHLVHVIEGGTGVASYELCLSHDDDHDEDVHVHFFCEQCIADMRACPAPFVTITLFSLHTILFSVVIFSAIAARKAGKPELETYLV